MDLSLAEVRTGSRAADNGRGIDVPAGAVLYICSFTNGVECRYIQDVSSDSSTLDVAAPLSLPA